MNDAAVQAHYRRPGLTRDILQALGHDPRRSTLAPRDLAALDQFHVGGGAATRRLAGLAGVRQGDRILDLGSGLGGPSRLLADDFGAIVTGIDLTADFCHAAVELNALTGLSAQVSVVCGDAVWLPFGAASFDLVWTEHVAMNIANRAGLYAECARVLRPGGRLAVYDIVLAGAADAVRYPVPWARRPAASHLLSPERLRAALLDAGLTETGWVDETAIARDWLVEVTARRNGGTPPPASLRLVMGDDFPVMTANLRDNFRAGSVGAVQAVFSRPLSRRTGR